MQAIVVLLILPLFILNSLGAIVAVVWLAVLGEWVGIGWGALALIGGALLCGLLMLPGLLFAAPAMYLMGKGAFLKVLGFLIGLGSLLWTYIVMSGWSMVSFNRFLARSDENSWIPYLLLAYAIATAPWAYMASKENNTGSSVSAFFQQIACAAILIMAGLTNASDTAMFFTFAGVMLFGFVVNAFVGGAELAFEIAHERRRGAI